MGLKAYSSIPAVRSVTLLVLFSFFRGQHAIMCYTCGDFTKTKITPPDTECNERPDVQKNINCVDRSPSPNNLGMTQPLTAYCATWINEDYASEADKAAGLQPKRWLERGCSYPGGVPDDCLVIDENAAYPTLKRTYQMCNNNDYCNGDPADTFLKKCFPSVDKAAAIKTSMNDSQSLRNYSYPTQGPGVTLTTRLPLTEVKPGNGTNGTQKDGSGSSAGYPVRSFICGFPVAAASLLIRGFM